MGSGNEEILMVNDILGHPTSSDGKQIRLISNGDGTFYIASTPTDGAGDALVLSQGWDPVNLVSVKLKVDPTGQLYIANPGSGGGGGTSTVVGTVSVGNFPALQAVSGTVSIIDTGTGTGNVVVTNFPATQTVAGTVTLSGTQTVVSVNPVPTGTNTIGSINTIPSGTQTVTGSVSVINFPATQPVSGTVTLSGTSTITGNITSTPSGTQTVTGTVSVSDFPATQAVSGTVAISGTSTITGAVTTTPSGTQTVAGTITAQGTVTIIDSGTGTANVTGTVTTVPSGTQVVSEPVIELSQASILSTASSLYFEAQNRRWIQERTYLQAFASSLAALDPMRGYEIR